MFSKKNRPQGKSWCGRFAGVLMAWVAMILLGSMPTQVHAQVGSPLGSCPATAFVTRDASGSNRLFNFNLATGAQTDLGGDPDMASVNGIGFRQQDGYIWGWSNGLGSRLVRIGAGGVSDLPFASPPAGLPADVQFFAADVSPATGHYVANYTNTAVPPANQLLSIDVTTNTVVGAPVNLTRALGTDIAFHPTDGNAYSVSSGGAVLRINPGTGVVTVLPVTLPAVGSGGFGGLFFDSQGTLYAYRASAGIVYRVFNVGGTGPLAYNVLTTSAPVATSLDSARCPSAPPQGAPAVLLSKTTVGMAGGPFNFLLNNTVQTAGTVTTTTAGTALQVDGDTATAGLQAFTVNNASLGQSLTIEENTLPAGWTLSGATCTSGAATVGALAGRTYTVPGSAIVTGALIQCSFTNTRQPVLRIRKVLPNGRALATDQFTLTVAGASGPATVTTTGATNTPAETATLLTATAGTPYTLSETGAGGALLANYTPSYSCTNTRAGGQTPSGAGSSFQVTPVTGDDLTCTFSNAMTHADLQVVKTASAPAEKVGDVVNFTLVFSNNGPAAASNAVMRDNPGVGLDCMRPSTTAACTAAGGASCPAATVPVAALISSSGIAIPVFPNGGVVTLIMQCTVTANALP